MDYSVISHPSVCVIGRVGGTRDGEGFIQRLWVDANARFSEIASLALKQENGLPLAVFGAMSDYSLSFKPWENGLSEGLYMAGVQCSMEAEAPQGWAKWVLPAFECVIVENRGIPALFETYHDLQAQGQELVYAIQEKNDPATGKQYLLFPIKKL